MFTAGEHIIPERLLSRIEQSNVSGYLFIFFFLNFYND